MEKLTMSELKKFYDTSITIAKPLPLNQKLIDLILEINPKSVFEFGANWGVNLKAIHEKNPGISILGMDISRFGVEEARKQAIPVLYGDERTLKELKPDEYDLVFTVSVLNHIPDEYFEDIIEEFKRICINKVILVESNQGIGERWFTHDYEKLGFSKIDEIISEPWSILFDYWIWEKEPSLNTSKANVSTVTQSISYVSENQSLMCEQ